MPTGKGEAEAVTAEDSRSNTEDLEFAIRMLKIKLRTAKTLPEKVRLYNQIKTLQENISKLESKGSARS